MTGPERGIIKICEKIIIEHSKHYIINSFLTVEKELRT